MNTPRETARRRFVRTSSSVPRRPSSAGSTSSRTGTGRRPPTPARTSRRGCYPRERSRRRATDRSPPTSEIPASSVVSLAAASAAATRVAGCDLRVPPADASASLADASIRRARRSLRYVAQPRRRLRGRASHPPQLLPRLLHEPLVDIDAQHGGGSERDRDGQRHQPLVAPDVDAPLAGNHSRFKCAMRWSSSDSPTR